MKLQHYWRIDQFITSTNQKSISKAALHDSFDEKSKYEECVHELGQNSDFFVSKVNIESEAEIKIIPILLSPEQGSR